MTEKSLSRLLQNADNRFFCDTQRNVIHDRQCPRLRFLNPDELEVLKTVTPTYARGKHFCPECKRKVAIRNGMRGRLYSSAEQLRCLMEFFRDAGAQTYDLIRLFVFKGGAAEPIARDCVELKVQDDTWRISSSDGRLTLYHNSYEVNDDYTRSFTGGFHVQNDHGSSDFHGLTKIICTYAYKYHEQAQKAYDRKLRQLHFETSIAVVSNFRRLDKRSALFAYFIYVDLKGRKAYHRQARYMKVLERKDRGDCSVITCRIPRWRRSEFERQMRVLKSRAIAERRMDYPEVCEREISQG